MQTDPFLTLTKLAREHWPAVEGPLAEFAAGRITYERALGDTLDQVRRDWGAFWEALQRIAPGFAHELGKELAGDRFIVTAPPLAPKNLAGAVSAVMK